MTHLFNKFISIVTEAHHIDRWDEIIRSNAMIVAAAQLCKEIEDTFPNTSALMVGGTVRDLLMGNIHVHDVDIATNAPLEKLEQKYHTHDIGKSKDFGIITIKYNNFDFEVANFRQEEGYSDNRRPDKVSIVNDFEKDINRSLDQFTQANSLNENLLGDLGEIYMFQIGILMKLQTEKYEIRGMQAKGKIHAKASYLKGKNHE